MPIEKDRQPTPFEQTVADHYNSCTPKEQRALDLKLQRLKAGAMASPHAVYYLFPALRTKTLKVKEPANG